MSYNNTQSQILPGSLGGLTGEIKRSFKKDKALMSATEQKSHKADIDLRYELRRLVIEFLGEQKAQKQEGAFYVQDSLEKFSKEAGMSRDALTKYLQGNVELGIRKVLGLILALPKASRQSALIQLSQLLELEPTQVATNLIELAPGVLVDLCKVPIDDVKNLLIELAKAIADPKGEYSPKLGGVAINISSYSEEQKRITMLKIAELLAKNASNRSN